MPRPFAVLRLSLTSPIPVTRKTQRLRLAAWVGSTEWAKALQSLSHFSYHFTNGEMIVCDLQGAIEDDIVVLTDPVIISKSGSYGPTDLGAKGIETFFFRPHAKFFAASLLQRTSRGPAELISAVACSIGPKKSQAQSTTSSHARPRQARAGHHVG